MMLDPLGKVSGFVSLGGWKGALEMGMGFGGILIGERDVALDGGDVKLGVLLTRCK